MEYSTNTFSPQYVQTASLQSPGSKHKVSFVNISSQQLNPGSLVQFFNKQSESMQPMPFTGGDIKTDRSGITRQVSEYNNVSNLPTIDTLPQYFISQGPSKDAQYRTPSQLAFNVPEYMLQMRATDIF